jgi:hypothetical protein
VSELTGAAAYGGNLRRRVGLYGLPTMLVIRPLAHFHVERLHDGLRMDYCGGALAGFTGAHCHFY